MSTRDIQISMLEKVAGALGPLCDEVVFVGGCTTSLFLEDEFTRAQVRFTDDVDLIVNVTTYIEFQNLRGQLCQQGFKENMESEVICRFNLGQLKVDFMPVSEQALGFGNKWYPVAIDTAETFQLSDSTTIKVVTAVLFIATKLEAYKSRGKGDVLGSQDIEDVINIFDGRSRIVEEIKQSKPDELRAYIKHELSSLLDDSNFEYAVQSAAQNDPNREVLIFERFEGAISD